MFQLMHHAENVSDFEESRLRSNEVPGGDDVAKTELAEERGRER